jgi:Transcriptional regulator, AbiEi antitoxin, Type IV TA system/Transcriptional regulator, AbiEi antitoxin N-terminal domain
LYLCFGARVSWALHSPFCAVLYDQSNFAPKINPYSIFETLFNQIRENDPTLCYFQAMTDQPRHALIKNLLAKMPRGMPFDLAMLAELGVSTSLAAKYVAGGWLMRLGQGVYAFPGDNLDLYRTIRFLQTRIQGLHIAGKSALSLQGVRHNLAVRDQIILWGDVRATLPDWFVARFPARYVHTQLFAWGAQCPVAKSLTTPPGNLDGLQVAVPERAILELLCEVGGKVGIEEAHNIFAGLRNLRRDVLGNLLACCTSVKTKRLFLTWSRETGIIDSDNLLRDYPVALGSTSRWMCRLKDGTLLSLKP